MTTPQGVEARDLRRYLTDVAQEGTPSERSVARTALHLLAAAPAAPTQPVAYIEHHKAGDNLVWDVQKHMSKVTPLYTHPSPPTGAEPPDDGELEAWRSTADDLLRSNSPNVTTLRRAAHLLQNAYLFGNAFRRAAATPPAPPQVGSVGMPALRQVLFNLRAARDEMEFGEHRSRLNVELDRLDVLCSQAEHQQRN